MSVTEDIRSSNINKNYVLVNRGRLNKDSVNKTACFQKIYQFSLEDYNIIQRF